VRKRNEDSVGVDLLTATLGFVFPTTIVSNAFMEDYFYIRWVLFSVGDYFIVRRVGHQRRRRRRAVRVRVRDHHEVVLQNKQTWKEVGICELLQVRVGVFFNRGCVQTRFVK
jgi:hypothetical protein